VAQKLAKLCIATAARYCDLRVGMEAFYGMSDLLPDDFIVAFYTKRLALTHEVIYAELFHQRSASSCLLLVCRRRV